MTQDIVERLLAPFSHNPEYGFKVDGMEDFEGVCREAAAEIVALREALRTIMCEHLDAEGASDMAQIARKALGITP